MTDRKPSPLPEGYQWRRPSETAAERLKPCEHEWVTYMIDMGAYSKPGFTSCRLCGAPQTPVLWTVTTTAGGPPVVITDNGFTANVIEGEHFTTDRDTGDETT